MSIVALRNIMNSNQGVFLSQHCADEGAGMFSGPFTITLGTISDRSCSSAHSEDSLCIDALKERSPANPADEYDCDNGTVSSGEECIEYESVSTEHKGAEYKVDYLDHLDLLPITEDVAKEYQGAPFQAEWKETVRDRGVPEANNSLSVGSEPFAVSDELQYTEEVDIFDEEEFIIKEDVEILNASGCQRLGSLHNDAEEEEIHAPAKVSSVVTRDSEDSTDFEEEYVGDDTEENPDAAVSLDEATVDNEAEKNTPEDLEAIVPLPVKSESSWVRHEVQGADEIDFIEEQEGLEEDSEEELHSHPSLCEAPTGCEELQNDEGCLRELEGEHPDTASKERTAESDGCGGIDGKDALEEDETEHHLLSESSNSRDDLSTVDESVASEHSVSEYFSEEEDNAVHDDALNNAAVPAVPVTSGEVLAMCSLEDDKYKHARPTKECSGQEVSLLSFANNLDEEVNPYEWEKPEWAKAPILRKTDTGDLVKKGGSLALPVTLINAFRDESRDHNLVANRTVLSERSQQQRRNSHSGVSLEWARPHWTNRNGLASTELGTAARLGLNLALPITEIGAVVKEKQTGLGWTKPDWAMHGPGLKSAESIQKSVVWEKPSWILNPGLKQTQKGEKLKVNGNLAKPITFPRGKASN
jgi:hypothetical protein